MKAWFREQFGVFRSNMTPATWIASGCMSVIIGAMTGDKTNPRTSLEHVLFFAVTVLCLAAIVVVAKEILQTKAIHPCAPIFRRLARETYGVKSFQQAQNLYLRINDALFVADETVRLADLNVLSNWLPPTNPVLDFGVTLSRFVEAHFGRLVRLRKPVVEVITKDAGDTKNAIPFPQKDQIRANMKRLHDWLDNICYTLPAEKAAPMPHINRKALHDILEDLICRAPTNPDKKKLQVWVGEALEAHPRYGAEKQAFSDLVRTLWTQENPDVEYILASSLTHLRMLSAMIKPSNPDEGESTPPIQHTSNSSPSLVPSVRPEK